MAVLACRHVDVVRGPPQRLDKLLDGSAAVAAESASLDADNDALLVHADSRVVQVIEFRPRLAVDKGANKDLPPSRRCV